MMRYDTNNDGWVDRAEWNAGQEARFKELDTNKDGKLSQDELFARTPAAAGNVLPSDRQFERQTAYFQRVDTDKDGFVSKGELIAHADRNQAATRQGLPHQHRRGRQAPRRRPATPARSDAGSGEKAPESAPLLRCFNIDQVFGDAESPNSSAIRPSGRVVPP
jgi:hypothetical protein